MPFTSHATLGKPLNFLTYLICMMKLQICEINHKYSGTINEKILERMNGTCECQCLL